MSGSMASKIKFISESRKEERRRVVFQPFDGNKAIMTQGAKKACDVDIDQCDACDCGDCDKSSCNRNDDKK